MEKECKDCCLSDVVGGLSDHKPKLMSMNLRVRRWRTVQERRMPRVRWERLREEEVREAYKARTEVLIEGTGEVVEGEEWKKICGVMIEAAVEVCGVERRKVQNPWTVGHEE